MCALEDEAAKVGIAPHLQLSLLSDLKHTGWTQAIATHQSLDPAMQEIRITVPPEIWCCERHSKLCWAQTRSTVTMPVVPQQHKAC